MTGAVHVESIGSGPRLVLVHGSISPGWGTWDAQRSLARKFTLVLPIRSGYAPNPPLAGIDFDRQADEIAELLEPGDHLVGHSYGGIVAALAAARGSGVLRSLTVIEPPALGMAGGDPVVAAASLRLDLLFATEHDPEQLLHGFLRLVGGGAVSRRALSPALEAGVRALMSERHPSEARIPLAALAAAPYPRLVVSSGGQPAFEAVCDALARGMHAERAVIPGTGHAVQRVGTPFNDLLAEFVWRAEAQAAVVTRGRAVHAAVRVGGELPGG